MKNVFTVICIWLLLPAGAVATRPTAAAALEYQMGGGFYQGGFAGNHFWDPYTQRFDRDEAYTVTNLYGDMAFSCGDRCRLFLNGKAGWIHDFQPESGNDLDMELLQAFFHYTGDRVSADVGKQPFSIGRGFIFDDEKFGIHTFGQIADSYYIQIEAARADEASPLVSITAGYRPGFLEKIELLGIYLADADDGFAHLLNRQIGLDLFSGEGDFFWVGMAADLFIGDVYFSGIGLYQTGRIHTAYPEGRTDFDISAGLLDVAGSYNFTSAFSAEAFLFAASGDRHPGSERLHAFISPLPYNSRADVFFNGGVDGHDAFHGFSLAGIRWAGVIAPGIELVLTPRPKWLVEFSAAALFPQKPVEDGSHWYGWETDLSITRSFGEDNSVYLLSGLLAPGDGLKSPEGSRPEPIISVMAGIALWF